MIFSLEPTRFGMFVLLAIGALILNTAYTEYCFMYDMLDINTFGKKGRRRRQNRTLIDKLNYAMKRN